MGSEGARYYGRSEKVALVRQCVLAQVSRAAFHARQRVMEADESDLLLSQLIEEYSKHTFYVSRIMIVFLKIFEHKVNRKRVQRLLRVMGLVGKAQGPNTSRPHPEHKVYPYLLPGIPVDRPTQVWSFML